MTVSERDQKAGWEVEGFIDRLTRRNGANDERLVLEAISHLRAFSRDCDTLRESNSEYADEVERLRDLVQTLLDNDPSEPIADNGMTVLDGWRERARRVLPSQDHRDT